MLARPQSRARSETPGLDAELLLRHTLRTGRTALYAHPERRLTSFEAHAYRNAIARRNAGEPAAYIIGRREFMGQDFLVDRRVLIPRPETELLVDRALAHVAGVPPGVAVDVGAGCGAIAISLAHLRPELRIYAADVSAGALAVASANAIRLLGRGQTQVIFVRGAGLAALSCTLGLVTANLPYIPTHDLERLPATVRDYEPRIALDGGPDGLHHYRLLLREASGRLAPGGTLLMECDPAQAAPLCRLAAAQMPPANVSVYRDLAGLDRVVEVRLPR